MQQPMPPPDGDRSRAGIINGLNWTYVAILVVITALRLYVRAAKGAVGWDDYMMFIALVTT